MDLVLKVRITDHDQILKAFDLTCRSKELYNFSNYHTRKMFIENDYILSYADLCSLIKDEVDSNNDLPYRRLPAAISQQVLKQLATNWFAFTRARKEYFKNPSKFLGLPKPPGYINKSIVNVVSMDASRCFSKKQDTIHFTKKVLYPVRVPKSIQDKKIKLIRVVPHHNVFDLEFVYEAPDVPIVLNGNVMSIDLGLNNLITTANDAGIVPFIVNGKIVKSINQNYNRRASYLKSRLQQGQYTSRQLIQLGLNRQDQLRDQLHKVSTFVIDVCIQHDIKTLVVGWNKNMKQKSNMGKVNNQNFVQVPFYKLRNMFEYKCKHNGIKYVETQEAYTSKCSYFDSEPIGKRKQYCGARISRGQFQTKSGSIVNADLNAAYNIHFLATKKRIVDLVNHPICFTVGSREVRTKYQQCISG